MSPHRIRTALDSAPPAPAPPSCMPAAVLVPVLARPDGLHLLLTRRAKHLMRHAGEVSFPGGRMEEDDNSARHTALRESHEEINLHPKHVDVAGYLTSVRTGTNFHVVPVLGFLSVDAAFKPSPSEVADIFTVPLAFACDLANHEPHQFKGRTFFAINYHSQTIWGATAHIVRDLALRLAS